MKIISSFISGMFVGFGIGLIILGLMAVISGVDKKLPEKRIEVSGNCIYVLRLPDGRPIDTVIVWKQSYKINE